MRTGRRIAGIMFIMAGATRLAFAQADTEMPLPTLTVSLGAGQQTRRDDVVSPAQYIGYGPALAGEYDWGGAVRRWYASVAAATMSLKSPQLSSDPRPSEAFVSGVLATGVRWRLSGNAESGYFLIGTEVSASAAVVRHVYGDPDRTEEAFAAIIISLAPTITWMRRLGANELSGSLGVPLVALVDRSYSDLRAPDQLARGRLAFPSNLRQANFEVSYVIHPERNFGFTAAYGVGVLELIDAEPSGGVAQVLSVGVVTRFGKRP
jgi:hypothetical protein